MTRFYLQIFIIISVFIGFIGTPIVNAYEDNNVDDVIIALTDEKLTDEEKIARASDGLNRALSLSIDRVNSLTEELSKREFEDESLEKTMQDDFLSDLDLYRTYYNEKLIALESLEALSDIQMLAKEVKEYRDTVYTPNIENIVGFALIFYNKDVIDIADKRFKNISSDIADLRELGLFEEDKFSDDTSSIVELLYESKELQKNASELILISPENPEPEDPEGVEIPMDIDILEATSTVIATSSDISDDESSLELVADDLYPTTPNAMLERSLSNIKEVYVIFVQISDGIQDTLGIE